MEMTKFRSRILQIIEIARYDDPQSRFFDLAPFFLIVGNIAVVIARSVIQEPPVLAKTFVEPLLPGARNINSLLESNRQLKDRITLEARKRREERIREGYSKSRSIS